jgi:hypothetical protein
LVMTNSTFSANQALGQEGIGGALFLLPYWDITFVIKNTILWDNLAATSPEVHVDWEAPQSLSITFSNVKVNPGSVWPGSGNINQNPQFVNAGVGNYRLSCASPCINAGVSSAVPNDEYDVDENNQTVNQVMPDRDLGHRVLFSAVDMGCYEAHGQSACADIAPLGGNGIVNVNDLLAVINNWGDSGFADIATTGQGVTCGGDGIINMSDLLAVINTWGSCSGGGGAGSLTSVQDCMDMATYELELEPHSPEWTEVVNKCVAGLCEAQIINCD